MSEDEDDMGRHIAAATGLAAMFGDLLAELEECRVLGPGCIARILNGNEERLERFPSTLLGEIAHEAVVQRLVDRRCLTLSELNFRLQKRVRARRSQGPAQQQGS